MFVNPSFLIRFTPQVVLHWTDDVADPQHAISSDALHRLENVVDARGRRIKVHTYFDDGPDFLAGKVGWEVLSVRFLFCSGYKAPDSISPDSAAIPTKSSVRAECGLSESLLLSLKAGKMPMAEKIVRFAQALRRHCCPHLPKVHKCSLPGPLYFSPEEVSTLEATPGLRERAPGAEVFFPISLVLDLRPYRVHC